MSTQDKEDLIDYEDEHDVVLNPAGSLTTNRAATAAGGESKDARDFSGIHSTGFRFVILFAAYPMYLWVYSGLFVLFSEISS